MQAQFIKVLLAFIIMLSFTAPLLAQEDAPVFSGPDMQGMLDKFNTDRAAFNRYFGRKNFKNSGRLLNIFGLSLLNVYSANIVSPQGEINCTPAVGPEMEQMEYLYNNYTVGQAILVQGTINGVAFGTLMLTPCQVWIVPNIDDLLPSAKQGNAEAQYQLGEIYSFGVGLPIDTKVGAEWYQRAAKQGHKQAAEALKLFADREHIEAYKAEQDRLAELARQEHERAAIYATASLDQLYKAVNANEVDAQMNLGRRYLEGKGVAQDENMGIEYLSKAAARGNSKALSILRTTATPGIFGSGSARAAFALGTLYAEGQGVPFSDEDAATWFHLAAKQDYPGAADLAKLHDDKVIASWRKAVEAGDLAAYLALAKRYLETENATKEDIDKAIPLLIHAAGLGNEDALKLLENQARSGWFANGNANAAFALGELFSKGIGVTVNKDTAIHWYALAANQGVEEAKQRLVELQQQATPVQSGKK